MSAIRIVFVLGLFKILISGTCVSNISIKMRQSKCLLALLSFCFLDFTHRRMPCTLQRMIISTCSRHINRYDEHENKYIHFHNDMLIACFDCNLLDYSLWLINSNSNRSTAICMYILCAYVEYSISNKRQKVKSIHQNTSKVELFFRFHQHRKCLENSLSYQIFK